MNVEIKFIKPIPEEQIDRFMDRTVHNVARITLDGTRDANHVPTIGTRMPTHRPPHLPRLPYD